MEREDWEKFLQETNDWLNPLWYFMNARTWAFSQINYFHEDIGENYPVIFVYENNGERKVQLLESWLKMNIGLATWKLQYKHPNIQRYIDCMKHYSTVCNNNHPF
jgi:hypothetical protein